MRNIPQSDFRKISKTWDERPEEKLSCWSHHPFVIMQVLRKLILAKKIALQLSRTFFSVQETRKEAAEYIWGNCDSAFLQTVFFWSNKCASPSLLFGRSPKLNKRRWWQFQSWRQWWGWRWFTMITMMTQRLWWHWYLWSKEKSKALVRSGKSNRSQRSRVGRLDTSGFFWLCKS